MDTKKTEEQKKAISESMKGNKNSSNGFAVKDAIHYVLTNYSDNRVERGQALRKIVERAVVDALDGDAKARDFIVERTEGKVANITQVTGADGGNLKLEVEIVGVN